MSFLKKLFGQKSEPAINPLEQQQFDEAWFHAVKRFQIVTGMGNLNIQLKHPQTHEIMLPHAGIGGTFSEWQAIRSDYDRRGLLFQLLYEMVGGSMNGWQTANYLVADRRADVALSDLEEAGMPTPNAADYSSHCGAFAIAHLNMTHYADALSWAQKATEASPENGYFQTILADALRASGDCEASHALYAKFMATAPKSQADASGTIKEMFAHLFARETGAVPSPFLALEIGESITDPAQSAEFWQLAETEFYDSPFFRMHHAYYLAKIGKMEESFAKLLALVQEMPWLKEASLNLLSYFQQFDPTGQNIMPEFQVQLRQTIQHNGWSAEGMHEIPIG